MNNIAIRQIIAENDRRNNIIFAKFNPITGQGSIGDRVRVEIEDFPIPVQWLPRPMLAVPLVKSLIQAKSIDAFILSAFGVDPTNCGR